MPELSQTKSLSVDDALNRILDVTEAVEITEKIASKNSKQRILATDQKAQRDIPALDNSAMDGYLIRTMDLDEGKRNFNIIGEIKPQDEQHITPERDACLEIMTGASVPPGKYTVVPIELVEKKDLLVKVKDVPKRNPIRKRGEGYKKGKLILAKSTVIRPYEIGLMIESGNMNCTVLKPIRLAVQVTGSEIDEKGNSNGPVLKSLISHWPGTTVKEWPVILDNPTLVKERMLRLKDSADVVLTTGGISMGKHDYILGVMEELGAKLIVRKVQQKPGKPFTVTKLGNTLFFHLPGNPISAVFTAEYYARMAIRQMLGLKSHLRSILTSRMLKNPRPDKTLFVPGKLKIDDQKGLTVSSKGTMKSHLMQLYRDTDVYIRLDPETQFDAGDNVTVVPYSTTCLP